LDIQNFCKGTNSKGYLNVEYSTWNFVVILKNKTPETRAIANRPEVFVCLKNKTPVISRSFNHQSKNEQFTLLLRSILCMCSFNSKITYKISESKLISENIVI